jgi:hypothetical protein
MPRQNKDQLLVECKDIISALTTGKLSNVPSFTLAGKVYTRAALVAVFQSLLDAQDVTRVAKAAWSAAVAKERKVKAGVRVVRNAFRSHIEGALGKGNPSIRVIGFVSKVPAKPTVEVRAAAAEKRQATREARGTMGKKQRKKITGEPPAKADEEKTPKK